jgi:glycosyltransferase involved in cell wall biosynthesis
MRIAFPVFSLGQSGGVKMLVRLADSLAARGHEVVMLVPERARMDLMPKLAKARTFSPIASLDGHKPIPLFDALLPGKSLNIIYPMARCLNDYDMAIANLGPTALAVKMSSCQNSYYFVQHDETLFFSRLGIDYWITRWSYKVFALGHVITTSCWLRDVLAKRIGYEPPRIPIGIDHEVFYPRMGSGPPKDTVLFFSRSEKWRGMNTFFKAMERVRLTFPDIEAIGIGNRNPQFNPSFPVQYLKPSDDQLAELYSSASLFVLTSVAEGFAAPPLEAMACGTPVVLTDCLGARDFAVDGFNCLMAPADSWEMVAKQIVRGLSNVMVRDKLIHNGLLTSQTRTFDRMEEAFARIIGG